MVTLAELRSAANEAEADFDTACRSAGYGDRWAAYRAEPVTGWPPALVVAADRYRDALQAFYAMRDGPRGFLRGRGL